MQNKLFVGNLPWSVDDARMQEIFAEFGEVTSARVVTDRESGKSRGFGFVEYTNDADAQSAIDALDGQDIDGRPVAVSIARPRE